MVEEERFQALLAYELLDTLPERSFDRLTELAAYICETPIALVSLVDDRRQWFKSRRGLDVQETPRDIAFCHYAIQQGEILEIPDAARDERFAENPLVIGDLRIRYYCGKPLIDPAGFALGTLCVLDRVPRKLSDDQIRALELAAEEVMDQIQARRTMKKLREQERSLQEAREKAEAADRLKTRFLANVSHEIRTPLNAIVGFPALMLEDWDHFSSEEIRRNLRIVHDSGQHLLTMVNDILDISRIESNQMELDIQTFDAREFLFGVRKSMQPLLIQKGLVLTVELDDAIESITGDPFRLRQVLINLISNAIKASRGGQAIQVFAGMENEVVKISVRDEGPGIPEQVLDRIFDSFFQANSYPEKNTTGSGLGLAIAERIVHLHGGEIIVSSKPGMGSLFSFSLPTHYEPPPVPGEALLRNQASAMRHDIYILIVEDSQVNLLLMEKLLERSGFSYRSAATGEEAIRLAREEFDLVLMDITLPGMDGVEAMRRMNAEREKFRMEPLPFVSLSADAMSDSERKYMDQGFLAHEPKPVDVSGFAGRVMDYVRQRQSRASEAGRPFE